LSGTGASEVAPELTVELEDASRGLDLALVARAGRTLVVLGPNGAGKSTTLQTVAGLYTPARARVRVGDEVLVDVGPGRPGTVLPPQARRIAYLDQRPALFTHLSVLGNVMFGPRSTGASRKEARASAERRLGAVGAEDLARRRPHALSGGQAQRVAIARALATSPRVVLLDEPLAAVDAPSVARLRAVLRDVLRGVTAVVVTHDVDDARALADDVVVLEGGRVVEQGTVRDVLAAPTSTFLRQVHAGREAVRLGSVPTHDHAAPDHAAPDHAAAHRPAHTDPPGDTSHGSRRTVDDHARAVAALVGPALAPGPGAAVTVRVAELVAELADRPGAASRVLAEDAVARVDLPGFDNSQMDGYAVRAADLAGASPDAAVALRVVADVPAGTLGPPLAAGTAAPIMTGAAVPVGADAVVRVEDARPPRFPAVGAERPPTVAFAGPVAPGTYVRRTGSDLRAGDVVVPAGARLGPAQLGALVAAGVDEVALRPVPRVLLVSTGSELVPAGSALEPGHLYDANRASLTAALAEVGVRVVAATVPDDPAALRAALAGAPEDVALVVTSGGVSAGAYEVVRETLGGTTPDREDGHGGAAGRVWFGHVAMQPGGPQGLGEVRVGAGLDARTVSIVAFPGNPVSSLVSFEVFLRPVLAAATGLRHARRVVGRAPLADPLDSPAPLHQVRRATLDDGGRVVLVGGPGSHLLGHYAAATVLVHVPVGVEHLDAGETVEYWEI
jgi:molybdopterin molybdotransferase